MEKNTKIFVGIGVAIVAGIGIYLIVKPKKKTTPPPGPYNPGPGATNPGLQDDSSRIIDSLITTTGNLIPELFAQNNSTAGCQAADIIDPFTSPDNVKKSDYQTLIGTSWQPSDEVKKMQTWLSAQNADIKGVIDSSGGVDGYMGPGFKTAYNMARKTCLFANQADLEAKSGAQRIT